ncbi:HAD family hydrolase [Natronogracilivirga saccharolytica]|uniref:HAD family phosphatase n=1 Tax=Natronogracilivirga saccharolytica TaxID=2812953 RepID=A0A8J7RJ90_9BACT|nr:HAD family phosphatase [Natronogracilivirga saccharolytica]
MSKTVIEAVIFDMDGLMIDTEPMYKTALQETARQFGYEMEDAFFYQLVGLPNTACKKVIAGKMGPGFPLDEFWAWWPGIWKTEARKNGIDKKSGLDEFLSWLSGTGLPAAVATSSTRKQASFSLEAAGVDYPFEHIVTGDDVKHGKPEPDIYIETAERLGVPARNCAALEDSENGVRAASSAGMLTIMIPDLKQPGPEVRNEADYILNSLHEARDILSELHGQYSKSSK